MVEELDFLPDDKPKAAGDNSTFSLGSIVLVLGILAVVLVFAVQLFNQNQTQPTPGERAPDFTLTSFEDETYTLSELEGNIVVVNFWGSWCGPCRAEAPDLQDIHEDFQDQGVLLIGVDWLDIEDNALAFIEEFDLTYINGPDIGESIADRYHIQGAPETFIVGRDGRIAHTIPGPVTYDTLAGLLRDLLDEEAHEA